LTHVTNIEEKIAEYDRVLSRVAKTDHRSQQLMELKVLGPPQRVRWSPVLAMPMILRTGANWQPFRANAITIQ
jgi:hypothetical protein